MFQLFRRIKNRFAKIVFHWADGARLQWKLRHRRTHGIFLFGHPIHPNVGDQAQAVCIRRWLSRHYPNHELIALNWKTSTDRTFAMVGDSLGSGDLIFCHSGYLLTDHHRELPVFRRVAREFRNHRVVIFPQTIHFRDENCLRATAADFNGHPDLVLMCRDHVSFTTAKKWFPRCCLLLFPDFVTTLIGTRNYPVSHHGIFLCARTGREALYKPSELGGLADRLEHLDKVVWGDTDCTASHIYVNLRREKVLDQILQAFASYRLIITDRYHGTIFALIAGTPVVVLSSADHKLESGVAWFPESFRDHVRHARDLDEALELAEKLFSTTHREPLSRYFNEQYYDRLHEILANTHDSCQRDLSDLHHETDPNRP